MFKKIQSVLCIICTIVFLFTACSNGEQQNISKEPAAQDGQVALTVTSEIDEKEYTMDFQQAPKRAVSLSGFTTEMMLALGLENQMVGTAFADNEILPEYKAAYESIPILSEQNPSREILLGTSADFITGWSSSFSETNFPPEFLQENHISFFVPRSEYPGADMNAVYEDFTLLGKIFHVEKKADTVIADMKEKIGTINGKVKDTEPVSVFLYDSGEDAPYTAGSSLPSDLIRLAGGKNIFADQEKRWLTVQWETVIKKNPQWIVVMQYNNSDDVQGKIDFLKNTPALKDIDAVKNNRILVLGLSDVIAGVRNINAVETMAEKFHPEAF